MRRVRVGSARRRERGRLRGCGRLRRLRAPTLLLATAIASCSDATAPEPPVATTVVPTADSVAFTALGEVAVLSATVLDQHGAPMGGASITWSSSAGDVATVTNAGLVTATGNGGATVTAAAGSASADVAVSVSQVAATLVVAPDSVVLADPGDTAQLTLAALDAGGSPIAAPSVSWTSADPSVATVDASGLVTAEGTGTVAVTAHVDGAVGGGSVRVEPEVTLVAAGPMALSGQVATQHTLAVRVLDLLGAGYGGAVVAWSTVPGSGTIVSGAVTESDATGHAAAVWALDTSAGAQQATASIESRGDTVQVVFTATAAAGPAVAASLVADSILLSGRGETAFLGPTYVDAYGNPAASGGLTWQTRDPAVATVAPDGLVAAVDAGATYVVASLGSPTDSILVTVSLRGAITITFDDGFLEAYTNAYPVFQELGLKGNVSVNPAQVGFPAYMTKAHLDEVHAAGWSIVSHGMTHDSLTTTTPGELDWELRASREWVDAQGYDGGNVFIVPYHVWDSRERDAIGQYYEATRGTSANVVSPDSLVSWRPPNPYDLTGIEAESLPFTSVAGRDALRALLQRTVDEGAFVDVFFHHLAPADVDAFRETLAVIDEFRDRVLPYRELYPRFARSVF